MPYFKLQSNQKIENESKLMQQITQLVVEELGKPESYVMVGLETNLDISFGGSLDPAAFIELRSIGLSGSDTNNLSEVICNLIEKELNISQDRIYINFVDISPANWGWNGSTF